jgi:dihydrofolate reductase
MFVSLDGVAEAPEQWHFPYFNEEMEAVVDGNMAAADTLLLGRHTYEQWAAFWPEQSGQLADYMNHTPKVVVSTTLKQVDWQNSTVISGDVGAEITRLKQQPGQNIGVNGSITLVRWLLRERLLDELSLLVHPIVLGSGRRLFGDDGDRTPLALLSSKTLSTGVLSVVYAPADQ